MLESSKLTIVLSDLKFLLALIAYSKDEPDKIVSFLEIRVAPICAVC